MLMMWWYVELFLGRGIFRKWRIEAIFKKGPGSDEDTGDKARYVVLMGTLLNDLPTKPIFTTNSLHSWMWYGTRM